jgi:MoaA/NifB/PqqE/SkfB family radical SAM enzyme
MRIREKIRWAGKVLFPTYRWRLPEQVIFFITDKCNLACAHCFYWANLNKETHEATLEEIDRFSKSLGHFSFLTLTGGEPFLRDDILEIIKIFHKNNSVSNVSIPTNGFFTKRILKTTENILRNIKNVDLAIKISLDGLEEKHDAIRGAKGAFSKAVDTYYQLLEFKKTNPHFKVGIIITYSTLNQESLSETLDYIKEKLDPDTISLNFARGNTKDPKIKEADLVNYLESYRSALAFLLAKKNKQTNLFYRFYSAYKSKVSEMVAQSINQNRYLFPCYAGRLLCIIDSSLNVYPCEMIGRGFGNIRAYGYDFRKLWFSKDAETLRHEIEKAQCHCTYECSLQLTAFFNLKTLLSLIPRMLRLNP